MNGPMCKSDARLDGKVAIVTGANTGIGKETALDLVQRGGKVYLACRSVSRCSSAVEDIIKETQVDRSKVVPMQLDLASIRSIRTFVDNFGARESKLDILINNAGVAWIPDYTTTEDGFEMTFGVNHLGHFLLTQLLVRYLVNPPSGGRVVTVASYAHAMTKFDLGLMTESNYSMFTSYSNSKAANILFSKELGKRLEGTGVTTYSLHPGCILTDLLRYIPFGDNEAVQAFFSVVTWPVLKTIKHGAQTTICCAVDSQLATETGKYYSDCREDEPTEDAQSDENALSLWELSVHLMKLQPADIHPQLR